MEIAAIILFAGGALALIVACLFAYQEDMWQGLLLLLILWLLISFIVTSIAMINFPLRDKTVEQLVDQPAPHCVIDQTKIEGSTIIEKDILSSTYMCILEDTEGVRHVIYTHDVDQYAQWDVGASIDIMQYTVKGVLWLFWAIVFFAAMFASCVFMTIAKFC